MKTTIKTLYRKGYNKTQIGQMLGIDRKTVRKVLKDAKSGPDASAEEPEAKKTAWPFMLDEYREYIEIQLAKELSITRIHQDLQKQYGIQCGYTTPSGLCGKDQKIKTACLHGAPRPAG